MDRTYWNGRLLGSTVLICLAALEWREVDTMHKRSSGKLQARRVRGIILRESFYDRNLCEVVSRVTRSDVMALLSGLVEADLVQVPDVEKGEVLLDSRGKGTFQKVELGWLGEIPGRMRK
jgi:hypothetical protein